MKPEVENDAITLKKNTCECRELFNIIPLKFEREYQLVK